MEDAIAIGAHLDSSAVAVFDSADFLSDQKYLGEKASHRRLGQKSTGPGRLP